MERVYSVSQVNSYISGLIREDFMLSHVSIQGEISNCKYHDTGHLYFSLKDEGGVISAVMFAGKRAGLRFRLCDGRKVIVTGSVRVYERDGKYQIYADRIEEAGIGDLRKQYEELKARLAEMGMFDAMYKKPIPKYVRSVGIVTARTGAAVQDIINIAHRRNPYVQLYLYPAVVQGAECPESVIKGIHAMEKLGVDVMIVGRGGGSIEDLWGFNDEQLAEAVFQCPIPIISAVGHETDFTIIDYVSDLRAPTPSAASELAVADITELFERIRVNRQLLTRHMEQKLASAKARRTEYEAALLRLSPMERLHADRNRLATTALKLNQRMTQRLVKLKHNYEVYYEALKGRNPILKLSKGFAHVGDAGGHGIQNATSVHPGDRLTLTMHDGVILATADTIKQQAFGETDE